MSDLIQVRKKAQLTLPQSIRQKLNIEEGDILNAEVRNGEIVLQVKKLVNKEQAWFWTDRWQSGEQKTEEDIRTGNVHRFPGAEDAISFLHKHGKKNPDESTTIDNAD